MLKIIISILLVLAGVAGAQTIDRDSIFRAEAGHIIWSKPKPRTYHIKPSEPGTIEIAPDSGGLSYVFQADKNAYHNTPITIGDWEDWVKHCYNDSTMKITGKGGCRTLLTYPSRVVWDYYDTTYTHKDPNDFSGFIQWLTKKYKKNTK